MRIEQLSIIDVAYGSGYSNDKYTTTDFTVVGDSFSVRFYTVGSGRYSFNARDLTQDQATYGINRPLLISWFVDGVLQDTRRGTPDWGMTITIPEDENEDYKYHEITFSQDENSYTSIGKIDLWMQEKRIFDNDSNGGTTTTTLSPQEVSVNDAGIRIASVDFENVCGPYSVSLLPDTGEFHLRDSEIWFTGSRTTERSYTVTVVAKDAANQIINSETIDFSIQNCNSSGACSEAEGVVGGGGTTPRPIDESLPVPSDTNLSLSDCDIHAEQTWITYDFNITSEATHYDIQVSRGNTFSIVAAVLNGVVGNAFQWSLPIHGTFFVRTRGVNADTGHASDWSDAFTMMVPMPDDCEVNIDFEPVIPETEIISQSCTEQVGTPSEPETVDPEVTDPDPSPGSPVNPTPPSGPGGCVGIGCGRRTGSGSGSNRTGTNGNQNQTGKAGCVGPGCFDSSGPSTGAGPGVVLPCTNCAPPIGYPGGNNYPIPPLQCNDGNPPRQVKITIEVDPASVEDETAYAVEVDNSEGSCYGGLSQGALGGQPNYTSYGKLGFGRQSATGAGNGGFFYSNNSITVPNAICPDCITQKCFKVIPVGASGTPTGSIIIDSISAGPSGVATSTKIIPLDLSDEMLCDNTPGYCCYPNANGCKDNVTKENCQAGRGKWEKYNLDASGVPLVTCSDDPCDPIGACCKPPECGYTEQDYCANVVSGVWESLDAGGTCDECTTTTTTTEGPTTPPPTTTECPVPLVEAATCNCDNGDTVNADPVYDVNGCLIGYSCEDVLCDDGPYGPPEPSGCSTAAISWSKRAEDFEDDPYQYNYWTSNQSVGGGFATKFTWNPGYPEAFGGLPTQIIEFGEGALDDNIDRTSSMTRGVNTIVLCSGDMFYDVTDLAATTRTFERTFTTDVDTDPPTTNTETYNYSDFTVCSAAYADGRELNQCAGLYYNDSPTAFPPLPSMQMPPEEPYENPLP